MGLEGGGAGGDGCHRLEGAQGFGGADEVDRELGLGEREGGGSDAVGVEEGVEGRDGGVSGEVEVSRVVDDSADILIGGGVALVVVEVVLGGGVQGA